MITEYCYNNISDKIWYVPVYMMILVIVFMLCILLDKVRIRITTPLNTVLSKTWKSK